nr:dolichyl pyrophosphate Man9GlcNAc2 alpha-1,3-glucosyltransferase [Onthophagus taurus]
MDKTLEIFYTILGILIAITLRLATSLHSYSGQGKPPMFGDYEAQRHWMEITVNLPVKEWYRNSTDNDLMYWGLDYPPLTAYHSFIFGVIAKMIDKDYVELFKSRGFESEAHKLFMRYTVLISDLLIFIPSVVLFFWSVKKDLKNKFGVILTLFYPGLILIDYGHFQYNCVSLGLLIFSVSFLMKKRNVLASIFFCLSLNFKQMELYHAFPYFFYLLSQCIPKPNHSILSGVFNLIKIAIAVVLTFVLVWFPFIFSLNDLFQVIHRLFPLARGVFEDKVSNFWCFLNIFYKLKRFCQAEMVRICTITTLIAVLPSSIDLFVRPNIKKFVPSLINSSLSFFLFSYQVHEKTILVVATPVLLYLPFNPIPCFWLLIISIFSMFPLLIKDGLIIATFSLTMIYSITFKLVYLETNKMGFSIGLKGLLKDFLDDKSNFFNVLSKHKTFLQRLLTSSFIIVSISTLILLCLISLIFKPPIHYPDLFPLLISTFSCLHFIGFYVYFNWIQLRIPQSFDDIKLKSL